jgi:GntR family transcriptional regulator/MocR family aminotransferase
MKNLSDEDWNIPNLVKSTFCEQIQNVIIRKITNGELLPLEILPPHRVLSAKLNVDKKTVAQAYEGLIIRGWLMSKPGSNTCVALSPPTLKAQRSLGFADRFAAGLVGSSEIIETQDNYITQPFIGVGTRAPNQALFPAKKFNNYCLIHQAEQLNLSQAELLKIYDGEYLKQAVFNDLNNRRKFGIGVGSLEIIKDRKTSLERTFKLLLTEPDEIVINTSPFDVVLARALDKRKARVLNRSILEPSFMEDLELMFKTTKVKAIYINPQCNFPERFPLSETQCIQLIELVKKYDVCIVEEDEDHEFWYGTAPYKPLAKYDHGGRLIYLASLSKATAYTQSLRIVVAPVQFIKSLQALPAQTIEHREIVTEMALADMISNRDLAGYAKKMRLKAKKSRDELHFVLDNHLGRYLSYVVPEHGLMFWLKFDERLDLGKILAQLAAKGIVVPYHTNNQVQEGKVIYMLLGFAHYNMDEAEGAAKMLKEIIEEALAALNKK